MAWDDLNAEQQQALRDEVDESVRTHEARKMARKHFSLRYGDNIHHNAFRQIKCDELLYSAGLLRRNELHRDARPEEHTRALETARDFVLLAGGTAPDINDVWGLSRAAYSSSDFPFLLQDIAQKATTLGYTRAAEIWPLITRQTSTRDFRSFTRITKSELPGPTTVGENGELGDPILGNESAETGAVESHAMLLRWSRRATINDSLESEAIRFSEAGAAVARKIGDDVLGILSGNPTMADGYSVFDSSNQSNLGTTGAISTTTVGEIFSLMSSQRGPANTTLNILPKYIVAAPSKAATLVEIQTAMNDRTGRSNIDIVGLVDARLTGDGWYSIANPLTHSGIEVVVPRTGSALRFQRWQKPAEIDDDVYLVGSDYVALAVDFRSLCFNQGS